MASGLAHEIRNPIGAVHGFAQLLAERFPDDSPEGRYAGVMLKALEEVLERVTRLLSFARVQKPDRKAEDLDGLVSNVVRLISPDFEQKGVTLRADLRASRPEAMVDAAKVKEVVLNLVLNALDSLEPGGQVLVTTLYYSKEGAHIVSVSDSGEGIPPEVVEKVFRPYFTTKSKGSGLGLAICRRIVEDHGGTIILESEPGSGTTVTVSFPRTPAP
jgi:two-component system sensor histidine kinase HydH